MTEIQANPTLEHLVARSAMGDRLAFADLYQATSAKLFAVLLRILKNEELAEDALQDVFIKVWHKAKEYHAGKGAVMTWLLSIARYRAIDMLRRAKSAVQTDSADDVLENSAADQPDLVELTGRAVDNDRLNTCLDELESPRRACLVLAYCEGYTHDELSRRLGSPVGTIKSWIRRGLQALKACLDGEDSHRG